MLQCMGILNADEVRRRRLELGLTQEEAAFRAGLSAKSGPAGRSKWNDIEAGRRENLTLETLERIARALKCKPSDLLK